MDFISNKDLIIKRQFISNISGINKILRGKKIDEIHLFFDYQEGLLSGIEKEEVKEYCLSLSNMLRETSINARGNFDLVIDKLIESINYSFGNITQVNDFFSEIYDGINLIVNMRTRQSISLQANKIQSGIINELTSVYFDKISELKEKCSSKEEIHTYYLNLYTDINNNFIDKDLKRITLSFLDDNKKSAEDELEFNSFIKIFDDVLDLIDTDIENKKTLTL